MDIQHIKQKLTGRSHQLGPALAILLLAGAAGFFSLQASHAATFAIANEAESGARVGNYATGDSIGASGRASVKFGADNPAPPPSSDGLPGVFITQAQLDRAKSRAAGTGIFKTSYDAQKGRADSLLTSTPNPFYMEQSDYLANLKYQWCSPDNDGKDNSLSEAVNKLQDQGNAARTLAMQFALSGDRRYADKAMEYFKAWASRSTVVNMYDFYTQLSPFDAKLRNQTTDYCSDRPWNFALDGLFQGYGLIDFSDAYVLLKNNGYSIPAADDSQSRAFILRLTEAVNSSFHAWTRWGDTHTSSSSYVRYRYDNHVTWGLAGLLSGAVALQDNGLAQYVLAGGSWTDSRAGAYKNPSPIRTTLDNSILADGRIIDPAQFDRPFDYTYFHLWPMQMVAQMAELHYGLDLWSYKGADGVGLEKAYDAAAAQVVSGTYSGQSWQYELAYNKWPTATNKSARDATNRQAFIVQSYGPVLLLFGQ